MATWPAKINYATGDVLTAAQMNDIGGELNDLYNSYGKAAGKNAVINGGFDIWQRGTSMAGSSTAFSADRWQAYRSVAGSTYSRQATNDTTNLPNIQYCARVQRDSGNTSTSGNYLLQNFESVNSIPFAGKTVTLSFYARAGANYSAASGAMEYNLATGTGTDQNLLTGFTGRANPILANATLTTTWQRFTATATLATTATQIAIAFDATWVGTAGANDYFEITGVQLELGSSATPFSRTGGTIQGELAACQRYYWRWTANATYSMAIGAGSFYSTSQAKFMAPTQIMRTAPTSIDYSSGLRLTDWTNFSDVTSLTLIGSTELSNPPAFLGTAGASFANYRPAFITASNNSSAYIGFSAEL